ncbi:MAG: hypothetical protein WCK33_11775 [Phycisphaerae bacterium]
MRRRNDSPATSSANHLRRGLRAAAWSACLLAAGGCGRHHDGAPINHVVCFGEVGMSPGQFSYPRGIDADGTSLWIVDKAARVQRIDPATGRSLGGWRMPAWSNGKPTGITVWRPAGGRDGDELIFLADTHYHRIMIYALGQSPGGDKDPGNDGTAWGERVKLVGQFGSYGSEPGHFTYPTDIAVLPTADGRDIDRLYVSEYGGTDRISIFKRDASGAFACVGTFGRFGSGSDPAQVEFSRPQSMAIDLEARELIVTDACNHRLGRFTLEGALVRWIGSPDEAGPEPGHFKYPYGLVLLPGRTALVVEYGNNRLQHVDLETGQGLGTYGRAGRGPGELAIPWGVALVDGKAYVLDSGNNRVMGFEAPAGSRRAAREPRGEAQ